MFSRACVFALGVVYIFSKVFAQDSYIAELMIESNVSLDAVEILSIFDTAADFDITDSGGVPHTVSLASSEVIAECLVVGPDTECNCSTGYTWSNDVCYVYSDCCQDVTCNQNVTHITPICVPKVEVKINGTAESAAPWAVTDADTLNSEFQVLNGFQFLTVTTTSGNIANFDAAVTVPIKYEVLDNILNNLKAIFVDITVDVMGLVTMAAPTTGVCYHSVPQLTCTFAMATERAKWILSKPYEYLELNDGSVVRIDPNCATVDDPSCTALALNKVTGIWDGDYVCGFKQGSVMFKARATLNVTLLPDEFDMSANPLVADCTAGGSSSVDVTVTVPPSEDPYEVWWSYNGNRQNNIDITFGPDPLVYTFTATITCDKTLEEQYVEIFFKNIKEQVKKGDPFCEEEDVDGYVWPNTPFEATVVHHQCPDGRSGYNARTCDGPLWQDVFNYCVDERLLNILANAHKFTMGQGAPTVLVDLIEALSNVSTFSANTSANTADVNASITILDIVAKSAENLVLPEKMLHSLIDVGSNLLNTEWIGVNDTVLHDMSADYIEAIEALMERIKVNANTSISEIQTANLHLKFCFEQGCNVSVFEAEVSLNQTEGISKIMAINNLMPKLENTFLNTNYTDLLVSATLDFHDNFSADGEILYDLPIQESNKRYCIFWNITTRAFSDVGCEISSQDENRTICKCNHLTSFSVLMSKGDVSTKELDVITTVGLAVSLVCLVALLFIEFLVWAAVVKSNLSHFRHTAIVNISTFRLLADICFLASSYPETLTDGWCLTMTLCKHLFYLAMFGWMMSLSVMLVHQLIFVFSPLRKRVFMFFASIVGYMFPIIIVGSSYVYYKYTYKPYYDGDTCWLVFERILEGSLHAFLIPVAVVIMTNVFSLVVVVVTLVKTSAPDKSKSEEKDAAKGIIKVIILLAPLFGVTWIIGFFLLILDNKDPVFPVANYAFTILNSFQGLFILIGGCIAEQRVREELIKMITGKSKGGDSSKNPTTTTYTKDS